MMAAFPLCIAILKASKAAGPWIQISSWIVWRNPNHFLYNNKPKDIRTYHNRHKQNVFLLWYYTMTNE